MKRLCLLLLMFLLVTSLFAGAQQEKPATVLKEEERTLTIWHSFTQTDRAEFIKKAADAYTAKHPNIKFEIEVYPWNTFDTKWKTALSAGNLPDLSTALPEHVVMMNQAGALASLNDMVSEMGNPFVQKPLDTLTVDGNIIAVPFYAHARVLWMRTDILDKYGLAEPKTMDDLLKVATEITKRGEIYGMAVPMKKTDFYGTVYLYIFSKALGGNLITSDGQADLTSKPMIDAINYMVELYKKASPQGSINYGDPETNDSFIQGKAAFYFESGFAVNRVISGNPAISESFKAIAPPVGTLNGESGWYADYINFVTWKGENEVIAKDFLKTLFTQEEYYKFLQLVPGGMIPTIEGVADSEEFKHHPVIKKHFDDIKVIQEGVASGSPIGADFGLTPSMNIVKSMGIIEEMLQNIVLGVMDTEEAAKRAQDTMNKEIARIQR